MLRWIFVKGLSKLSPSPLITGCFLDLLVRPTLWYKSVMYKILSLLLPLNLLQVADTSDTSTSLFDLCGLERKVQPTTLGDMTLTLEYTGTLNHMDYLIFYTSKACLRCTNWVGEHAACLFICDPPPPIEA